MNLPLWSPSPTRIIDANLSRFIARANNNFNYSIQNYSELYNWSITQPEEFWPMVWRFTQVKSSKLWDEVLRHGKNIPETRWFGGARLNFAENLLQRRDDKTALIFWGEDQVKRTLSYRELYQQVAQLAAAMRTQGVTTGDRVVGFMPNMPETIIAMLATTSIGAIWSSCSPDFGVNGAVERFSQIEPKLLFTADGYWFKGQKIDSLLRATHITQQLPTLQHVVVIPYIESQPSIATVPHATHWHDFIHNSATEIEFTQLPFDHPLYILYSSGTTGLPKCIVHGAGGTLLQHLKELVLHTDLKAEDRIFYFTTCGWMMWNWLVSSLAVGATVLLYDGSPFHPHNEILFDYAEQEQATIFGTSAKYLSALEKSAAKPNQTHNLSSLKTLLSTGSPLLPESFDFVYRDIKQELLLASISGGTDIISCFALGNPLLPVYKGELQCRGLGMKVAVYNEQGEHLQQQQGELVCEAPAPSMPICFWGDADGARYRAAYFERFANTWAHGDYAELTAHDGMIIYGRSDTVLNPGGVRIGTAEIYRQVEQLPEIQESIAVAQQWHGDVRIILFVILKKGLTLNDALISTIKTTLRNHTTPRHVPAKIIQVGDIPRTRSGKIVELTVRDLIHNRPLSNTDALANPEALEFFRNIPTLELD